MEKSSLEMRNSARKISTKGETVSTMTSIGMTLEFEREYIRFKGEKLNNDWTSMEKSEILFQEKHK